MKHQALLTIHAKLKRAISICYFVIFVFYFSVVIDFGENCASVWQEERTLKS